VRVHGRVNEKKLEGLKNGITVEGVRYKSIKASIENRPVTKEGEAEASKPGTNTWLSVTLKEGKNREIRRVMGALDLDVSRLIRVGYGPFALSKLPVGQIKPIEDELMKQQIAGYFKDK
jgi:23S rRNA pseudouridine2605 synthase